MADLECLQACAGMRVGGGHRRSCAVMIIMFAGLAFASQIVDFSDVDLLSFLQSKYSWLSLGETSWL